MSIHELRADKAKIAQAIHDTKQIMDRIDLAIDRVEAARSHISILGDELRMQQTITKERLKWIMGEVDRIKAEMEKLAAEGET